MSNIVKYFHSSMPGAPVVSGTAGTMIALLDACLVNGFGLKSVDSIVVLGGIATVTVSTGHSAQQHATMLIAGATPGALNGEKRVLTTTATTFTFDAAGVTDQTATGSITCKVAPAGWLKAFSGTNKAAYKIDPVLYPDSPAMLCHFDDSTTFCAKITGYESMAAIDTGSGMFPSIAQRATGLWCFKSDAASTSPRPWFVVADDRFVYVGIRHYATDNNNFGPAWFCFGDFASKNSGDTYDFLLTGNFASNAATASNVAYSIASPANSNGYTFLPRAYTGLGGSVPASVWSWPLMYAGSGGSNCPLPFPNPVDYGVYLCPADLIEGTALRGRLPGILFIPQNAARKICLDAATAYFDTEVPSLPNKTVGFFPCTTSGADWGVVAFDLTGPWEH